MEREGRRRRGRRSAGASANGEPRREWRGIERAVAPIEVLPAAHIDAIHEASFRLLAEIGIEFMAASARDVLRRAGADVDDATQLVRLPRELVLQTIALAPSAFTLTPRNPANRLQLGGDHVSFSLVAGPPFVHDCVNGRRSGNMADYERLIRLAQSFDIIHYVGNQPTVPTELPVCFSMQF